MYIAHFYFCHVMSLQKYIILKCLLKKNNFYETNICRSETLL
jgi:hypothetical protein